jgi:hypothetical protein
MEEAAGEDRGWQAANDNGRWLVDADSKGPTMGQTPEWADNRPGLTISQTSKGADDGPGLTMSQTSKGPTMG